MLCYKNSYKRLFGDYIVLLFYEGEALCNELFCKLSQYSSGTECDVNLLTTLNRVPLKERAQLS